MGYLRRELFMTPGGKGTNSYTDLLNKPTLNSVEINGDKSSGDYGIGSHVINTEGTVLVEGHDVPELTAEQVVEVFNQVMSSNNDVLIADPDDVQRYKVTGVEELDESIFVYVLFANELVLTYELNVDEVTVTANAFDKSLIIELEPYQYSYQGYILPAIDVDVCREIFNNDRAGIRQILRWMFFGSESNFRVVSSDHIAGNYSFDILVHNRYHCSYTWTEATTGIVNPEVSTGIFPEVTVTSLAGATVTARKGTIEKQYTVGEDDKVVISIPEYGNWEFSATDGDTTITKQLNIDTVKQYALSLPIGLIYGVEWNRTSSPVWTRTDDAALFTDPVPFVNDGTMTGEDCSSPFDDIYPWSGMIRVTDPAAGELVAVPKFYYKWTVTASKMALQISDKKHTGFRISPAHMDRGDGSGERDVVYIGRYHCSSETYKSATNVRPKASITRATARTNIHNLGSNIWQLDHALWWTINMLYLVEFANANCQGTIGYGRGNGSSTENMGYTDTMPYHTGTMKASKTEYGVSTQYRNIEGLWDNVLDWCDGIYFSGANVYHILNPEDFSDTEGGTLTGTRATTDGRVITGFTFPEVEGFEWAGYPSSADIGSAGTTGNDYFCDNEYYNAGAVVLRVGGNYDQSRDSGLFYRHGSSTVSHTNAYVGARLQKLP